MRFFWLLVFVFCAGGASAQSPTRIPIVRGSVVRQSGAAVADVMVEIRNLGRSDPSERVPVLYDGSFEFRRLEEGQYDVRITDVRGAVIQQDFVWIRAGGEELHLRLRQKEAPPLPSGTVSLQKLLRPTPSSAQREFLRSQRAFEKGDTGKSIEHLSKAIRIHPAYAEAHNNLGVRYMSLNQYDKAAEEFQKTVELDPESAKGHLNLSLAWSMLRRYREAEPVARRAVELDPQGPAARYGLGQILAAQEKNDGEALENLRQAVERFPRARLTVARILTLRGAKSEAAAELRKYLGSPNPERRQDVEAWLKRLAPGASGEDSR